VRLVEGVAIFDEAKVRRDRRGRFSHKLGGGVVPGGVATGLYFPSDDRRHGGHALTQAIRTSKLSREHDEHFAQRIARATREHFPGERFDFVITPPPKPGEADRLAGIRAKVASQLGARPVAPLVQTRTVEGYRGMSVAQRRRAGAHRYAVDGTVRGRTVLLADDVVTSGTTAREIVRALKRAGAKRVRFVAVAQATSAPEDRKDPRDRRRVVEAAEVGKPGTNWKQVTPEHRRKIDAIVRYYMKKPHPFGACVRDNTKRFGKDRAERICAVVKDMGRRTTKWRKGGGKRLREAAEADVTAAVFDEVIAPALDEAGVTVDELAGWVDDAEAAGILAEEQVDPADLTAEQLVEAADAARARLRTLERLSLPTTGPGASYDRRLVEATFTENLHPRGKKGSTGGGKFVAKGSSGQEVRAVQRRIGSRVDGTFGDKTRAAVMAFQKRHGLKVDGVVGRQTVAALRGRKDAKRVKVGSLSQADLSFLSGHVRGKGGKSRSSTRVVEAVAVGSFLERVKSLELGEHARLPDGGAVKHHATEDGRGVWTAGQPRSYAADGMSWGEQYRSPEEAVAEAFTNSARTSDPASLGGTTSYGKWSPVTVNGRAGEFRGVNENGQPLVRFDGQNGDPVSVAWPGLAPHRSSV
jgi:peptidoglycan hydrolase-like protein with peptidoglycan-binding domain/adenine/guanine phosphoribosyltransferase-like PRPP-binding protein